MKTKYPALNQPNPKIKIRPASPDDLTALMETCWQDRSYEVGMWLLNRTARNQRDRRGANAVVVANDGSLIGYGQLTLWPRCAEISDLVVAQEYRSQGYGTAIIQYLVQEAIRLKTSCVEIGAAESNTGAIALYHRLGFQDQRTILMNLGGSEREPVIYMRIVLDEEV